jgi:hypothetical protein
MSYFDLVGYDGCLFVEKTDEGVRVNCIDFVLDGDKVMLGDKHIYSISFECCGIVTGKDFTTIYP